MSIRTRLVNRSSVVRRMCRGQFEMRTIPERRAGAGIATAMSTPAASRVRSKLFRRAAAGLLLLVHLEPDEVRQHGEADGIGADDDPVGLHETVSDPEAETGCEKQEHLQRNVAGFAGPPGLLH